jgi:hypothetical protein
MRIARLLLLSGLVLALPTRTQLFGVCTQASCDAYCEQLTHGPVGGVCEHNVCECL